MNTDNRSHTERDQDRGNDYDLAEGIRNTSGIFSRIPGPIQGGVRIEIILK